MTKKRKRTKIILSATPALPTHPDERPEDYMDRCGYRIKRGPWPPVTFKPELNDTAPPGFDVGPDKLIMDYFMEGFFTDTQRHPWIDDRYSLEWHGEPPGKLAQQLLEAMVRHGSHYQLVGHYYVNNAAPYGRGIKFSTMARVLGLPPGAATVHRLREAKEQLAIRHLRAENVQEKPFSGWGGPIGLFFMSSIRHGPESYFTVDMYPFILRALRDRYSL